MCWECDHPNATRLEYLDHLNDLIAQFGWAVQGVERDRDRPPWAYTVGLTRRGLPELIVTGMQLGPAMYFLDDIAGHALHAAMPAPGERVELDGGPEIQFVEVAEPAAHLMIAVELCGPGIKALQVVHADDRGHWPWQVGYRGVRGGQPVLGRIPQPADS
jgi:hypothetical protein